MIVLIVQFFNFEYKRLYLEKGDGDGKGKGKKSIYII